MFQRLLLIITIKNKGVINMNNLKKIGLTALSASLVSISANAGTLGVSGSASLNMEGHTGNNLDKGTTFSMGNSVFLTGSGEMDNGITVSLSYELDQNKADGTNSPFDNHSLTLSSDTLGTLKFTGHGGDTASNQVDTTAAGDMWDNFDGLTISNGSVGGVSTAASDLSADLAQTASAGNNAILYTSPELIDGLTLVGSYQPQSAGSGGTESGTGYGINYSGVEGLTINYAETDVVGSSSDTSGDNTVVKATYAYGPVTVSYSAMEHDEGLTGGANDIDMSSYAVSYTITDDLSVTYGYEESSKGSTGTKDAEITGISASYTMGGMSITAKMQDGKNLAYGTAADQDIEYWGLGASFAF